MKDSININDLFPSLTEMTLDLMELIGYRNKNCELLYYNKICYKVEQKCLNKFEVENYFLQYN